MVARRLPIVFDLTMEWRAYVLRKQTVRTRAAVGTGAHWMSMFAPVVSRGAKPVAFVSRKNGETVVLRKQKVVIPCSGGSVCTEDSGTVQCRAAANRTGSVPEDGIGMAPQLLRNDDGLLLVYGDSVASLIRVASIRGGRIFGNEVLDGAGGALGQVEGGVGTDLGAAMDGATLIVAYRNHIDQSIRLYSGTVDLSGERIVFDEGTALSQEPGGLDRLHGADLDVMQMNGQRAVSFKIKVWTPVPGWVRLVSRTGQPSRMDFPRISFG